MPVIPNDPACKFSVPFSGITAPTVIHAMKIRVDQDNGSLNGDEISGDIELDSLQGQIDVIYRVRDKIIDFFIARKGDFVECDKVAAMLRKMVDEAVVSAKNDPNPQILEFDDEDDEDSDGGDEYEDDDDTEDDGTVEDAPPASSPPPRPASQSPRQHHPQSLVQAPVRRVQAERKGLAGMDPDLKRKLLISAAVAIVAIGGFILMGRTPKETDDA